MNLLLCNTLVEAQDSAAACHRWMTSHTPGYFADCWDLPKQRVSDGKFSLCVDDRVLGAVTQKQRAQVAAPNTKDSWSCVLSALTQEQRDWMGVEDPKLAGD